MNAVRGEHKFHNGDFTAWSEVRTEAFPCPAGAGETIGVASYDIAPWDEFTTELDASPVQSSGLEPVEVADEVQGPETDGEEHDHGDQDPDRDIA